MTRPDLHDTLSTVNRLAANRLRGIKIMYEDPDVIVIEKPAGLLVQALRHGREQSVEAILTDYVRKGQWKSRKQAYLVHRLDRETSGVMVVAKTESVQDYFRSNWNDITEKTYLARIEGTTVASSGVFESYLYEDSDLFVRSTPDKTKGKYARTEWRVFQGPAPSTPQGTPQGTDPTTLVEALLKTGRKNQIRVQFADAGHPVVGDTKYGRCKKKQPWGQTLCLHAWKLRFIHPHTSRWLDFKTPLPQFCSFLPFRCSAERENMLEWHHETAENRLGRADDGDRPRRRRGDC